MSASSPRPPTRSGAALAWLLSALVAGGLAGGLDAGQAIARGIGGISRANALMLVMVSASLVAAIAGLVGLVCALGSAAAAYTDEPERAGAWLAAIGTAPVATYDAFALFAGHRAAGVPGHSAISAAVALAAIGGVFLLAKAIGARLREAAPSTGSAVAAPLSLVVCAAAAFFANRSVLPRLYLWFHATLALATVAALGLGLRLCLRRARAASTLALVAIVALGAAASLRALGRSQVLRYAASERTSIASFAVRAILPLLHPGGSTAERSPSDAAAAESTEPLPAGPRRPEADVLLITIDALRADHVGAYGYARATTPHIDALAATGTRFARAYSQAPHTSFSVASLLTSKYFPAMARLAPGEKHDPIAAVLRNYGWKTAAFYPPAVFYIDSEKLKPYQASNFDFEYVKLEYIDAEKRADQVIAYYANVNPARSFVWIHFFEPHEPYVAHPGFPFGAGDIDRYDSEIAYTDAAVGRLVAAARARRPGTVVIVAADHGEEFDEHGGRYHGSSLYEEQLRVPLIINVPGLAPHVVGGQVELIDVTPTVLALLDIPVPARMRGTDLGPWLGTPAAPADRLPPAFSELEDKRMVVLGRDKLLCDLRAGFCAYYDLAADPHERRNLADERPGPAATLRLVLDDWLSGHDRLEPGIRGPGAGASATVPRAIELGRLGDASVAPELAALLDSSAPARDRREAAQLLVDLPPQLKTDDSLVRATRDSDPIIARWATVGAARLGDAAARALTRKIAADDGSDPQLRVRAALALATLGSADGLSVLARALDGCSDILLCRRIIVALGQLHDPRAIPILVRHLPEVQNRGAMVAALGAIGDRSAETALLARLTGDEYVNVRVAAAEALAAIGDRSIVPKLRRAIRRETEPSVVAAVHSAVASLEAR
jgi:sulfatase-like protein/HEAT repeat protein/PBS lyase HEAT-like repeat-containing protein